MVGEKGRGTANLKRGVRASALPPSFRSALATTTAPQNVQRDLGLRLETPARRPAAGKALAPNWFGYRSTAHAGRAPGKQGRRRWMDGASIRRFLPRADAAAGLAEGEAAPLPTEMRTCCE